MADDTFVDNLPAECSLGDEAGRNLDLLYDALEARDHDRKFGACEECK